MTPPIRTEDPASRRIIHDVGGSYRHRFGRVVIAAALVFGLTAVVGAAIQDLVHKSEENTIVYIVALAGATMSQIGITFYAGLARQGRR